MFVSTSIETMKLLIIFAKILLCQCLSDRLKNLREKAKTVKNDVKILTESKRGASLKFLPKSDILYPGLDKQKIEKVKKLWDDYYECQKALYESTRKMVVPDAVAFLQGSNTILECEVCESPRDLFLDTKWFYTSDYNMDHIKEIKETSTLLVKNDSLHIYNIGEAQGGLYVCQKGNHSARPYIVQVFTSESTKKVQTLNIGGAMQQVVPQNSSEGEQPAFDAMIPELGLRVTTRWEEWTQCSRCDQIGKRYRTGICTVAPNRNQTESRTKRETFSPPAPTQVVKSDLLNENKSETTTNHDLLESTTSTGAGTYNEYTTGNSKAYVEDKPRNGSLEDDLAILTIFEDGIPCRSKLLSGHIQNLDVVKKRSSEVMFAFCKIPCPKDIVFVVVDEKGNILETANNSDGVYSVLQGLPKNIPSVTRTLEYARYKSFFKIECPGKRDGDIPVEWYVGRKALTNKLLEKQTHGRVHIDEYNRINFKPVLFEDGRLFSCWQRKELVGTIRLIVEKEHNLKFQKPIVFIGTFIIFALFFKIYYQAFTLAK